MSDIWTGRILRDRTCIAETWWASRQEACAFVARRLNQSAVTPATNRIYLEGRVAPATLRIDITGEEPPTQTVIVDETRQERAAIRPDRTILWR